MTSVREPAFLAELRVEIEESLDALLPPETAEPARLHAAVRYSVMGGGKRLRGVLAMEAAACVGPSDCRPAPLAAALEMIHAYSLVHDDLPCMDDDDMRRGKPSTHKAFGEAMALLAGDALLTHAFEVLSRLPELCGAEPDRALQISVAIARAAGSRGMIAGQVLDLEGDADAGDADQLKRIHARKTGDLIRASVRSGAMLAGAGRRELDALDRFAEQFGLAFQIVDDILDVTGDEAALGKPVGSDARQRKLTYPGLYGLERSRKLAQERIDEAIEALGPFGPAGSRLAELARFVVDRQF